MIINFVQYFELRKRVTIINKTSTAFYIKEKTKLLVCFMACQLLLCYLCQLHKNIVLVRLLKLSSDFLLVSRVFTNGPGDLGSIPGHVIPKNLKMILDTYLLNTQQYKVHIKGNVEQSRERSSALLYTSV